MSQKIVTHHLYNRIIKPKPHLSDKSDNFKINVLIFSARHMINKKAKRKKGHKEVLTVLRNLYEI